MTQRIASLGVVLCLAGSLPAPAQERGQYIPGFQGLNAGMQAPPGFTYANYFLWYPSDTFKGREGKTGPIEFDLDLVADFNVLAHTTQAKLFGGQYGMAVMVPIVSTAVSLPRLGAGIDPWGLGDVYFEPINLGWHRPGAHFKAAYGFVAPTGSYDDDGPDTTTTDYWGHELTFAVTKLFTASKMTQLSVATNWEFHATKRHEDVKVGNNMTIDYAVGKTFVKAQGKRLLQLGVAGYAEFQLSDDSGDDAPSDGGKDRVFALGPEVGLILPQNKFNLMMRLLPEFGARSRTSGVTLWVAGGKSF